MNVFTALEALVTAKPPAPTPAVAATVWLPSDKAMFRLKVHVPSAVVVAVPTVAPSMRTVTVLFGTAVPEIGGDVKFVCEPLEGVTTEGAVKTQLLDVHEAPVGQSLALAQRTHVPDVALHAGVLPAHAVHDGPHAAATEHEVQLLALQTTGSLTTSLNTNPEPLTPAGSASI